MTSNAFYGTNQKILPEFTRFSIVSIVYFWSYFLGWFRIKEESISRVITQLFFLFFLHSLIAFRTKETAINSFRFQQPLSIGSISHSGAKIIIWLQYQCIEMWMNAFIINRQRHSAIQPFSHPIMLWQIFLFVDFDQMRCKNQSIGKYLLCAFQVVKIVSNSGHINKHVDWF